MASPNIVNVVSIYGNTALVALANSSFTTANIIQNSAGTSSVYKLNVVIVSNNGANNITCNIVMNRSGVNYYISGNTSIPGNSSLIALGKDTVLYMIEGDTLQANVSSNGVASIIGSYEVIS